MQRSQIMLLNIPMFKSKKYKRKWFKGKSRSTFLLEECVKEKGWTKVCSNDAIKGTWRIIPPQDDAWSCGMRSSGSVLATLGILNNQDEFYELHGASPNVLSESVIYKRCVQAGVVGVMLGIGG